MLRLRQSGQNRVDGETDGLQLLDSVATQVVFYLTHNFFVFLDTLSVAKSRSIHNCQRIFQPGAFHVIQVIGCYEVRLTVSLRFFGRLVS